MSTSGQRQLTCPRDGTPLRIEKRHGLEIDRCPKCKGMWLDAPELDELESKVIVDEHARGTLVYGAHESTMACPVCQTKMTAFQYHGRPLELDECPKGHGFWLDNGEDEKVLDVMEDRLRHLRSGQGFVGLVRNLFGKR